MRKILANPMFYKDTTQLVRHKSFPAIMILLFSVTLLAALPLLLAEGEGTSTGQITMFVTLAIFGFYALIILSLQSTMNTQEIINKSAEMYELTGMSVESITIGKTTSICAQLLFGFSCLLPLLVISYFLGGVDLLMILSLLFGILLAIPLFAVLVIAASSSVSGQAKPGLAQAVNGIIILGILPLGFMIGAICFGLFFALKSEPAYAALGAGAAVLITIALLFLIFYYTCHMLCRFYDSRESNVKAAYALTILTIVGIVPFLDFPSPFGPELQAMLLYGSTLSLTVFGVYFFVQPYTIPKASVVRYTTYGSFRRGWHWFFRHGPTGTMRTMLLIAGAIMLCRYILTSSGMLTHSSRSALSGLNVDTLLPLVLQCGFYVGLLELLCRYGVNRKKIQRHMPLVFLIFMTILAVLFGNIFEAMYRDKPVLREVIRFVAGLLSPFAIDPDSDFYNNDFNQYYLLTGILGWCFLIIRYVSLRRQQNQYIESVLQSVYHEVPALTAVNIDTQPATSEHPTGDLNSSTHAAPIPPEPTSAS